MQMEEEPPPAATPEELLLAAMRSLPGVTCVSVKPVNDGKKPNDHGVRWKLNGKLERCACTKAPFVTLDMCEL